ncbi:MAG TPA: endonuclease/exonuclease/phosphatase family protein [Paracoccus sp.]|nr:endonuclease/exonuclease/phosphatase family protein [Paracoccus sp. (in: a-proteobacteria)]
MRVATFNVQNLRLRARDGVRRYDGARDHDMPEDATPEAAALDLADRRLTASVMARAGADVFCLQEVFDRATLDHFHNHLLRHAGAAPWPHRVCLPGNDGAGRDLAVMSRLPLAELRSHADLTAPALGLRDLPDARPDRPVFCRDCLMVRIGALVLFNCHFKAPWPDPAFEQRRLEALALRALIARYCPGPDALWLVLGDLNEPMQPPGQPRAISPLLGGFSVDLVARMPEAERWTWAGPQGLHARPDAMLASPALARRFPLARPVALREGMGLEASRHAGPRLPDVGAHRPRASDHALLMIDFEGLGARGRGGRICHGFVTRP